MKVWWNCSPRSHFSFIFLCCCSKLCCYCAGSKSGGKYLPMNYASPLQTIIPGSPWKRRTTTATLITSMPVQLWVFFIHYGSRVWLICFLWSPPTPFLVSRAPVVVGFYSERKVVIDPSPLIFFLNFVLHAESLSGFLVSCWIALQLLLLSKWLLPGDTHLSFSFFSFTLKRIMHFFWLSKGIPYKSRKIWLLERAMVIYFFKYLSPKTLPVMISPEAAEKGFHQRETGNYAFQIQCQNFRGDRWGRGGVHAAALKAYYSSETNNGDF